MPRFFKRKMLATINTTKHYVHHSPTAVASSAVLVLADIDAVALPSVNLPQEVRAGAVVKAISVEIWVLANGAPHGSFTITVEKAKGGQPDITFAQNSSGLHTYPNKANILYTTQGFIGGEANNAVPLLKQWVAIPKGKQRFALGDQLRINLSSIVQGIQFCGMIVYKEYY